VGQLVQARVDVLQVEQLELGERIGFQRDLLIGAVLLIGACIPA